MLHDQKIVVVMPAYNAERTLRQTVAEIPRDAVDALVLVDDGSRDQTVEVAHSLGVPTWVHRRTFGYGRNQKTCYTQALQLGADVVVMLHPDYQYTPKLIPAMASLIALDEFDVVLGSRILGGGALAGGMPPYKYVANRALTFVQNMLLDHKLAEYHTGFRAFSRRVLEALPLGENADDFVFDNQMLAQAIFFGYRVGEITCPTRYFAEASSIPLGKSIRYGCGVLRTSVQFWLAKRGLLTASIFSSNGRRLRDEAVGEFVEEQGTEESGKLKAESRASE